MIVIARLGLGVLQPPVATWLQEKLELERTLMSPVRLGRFNTAARGLARIFFVTPNTFFFDV